MQRRKAMTLSAFLLASPLVAQTAAQTAGPASPAGDSRAMPDRSVDSVERVRMRALITQMQDNLASLPSGYSATKHQFELEIEMWRLLLNRMEREAARK